MNFKEITIPVPWGHIAGKLWGDESNPPVITLHGYQDSAASFDNLIPLLPTSFHYICLDLPSHGKSSHIPTQTFITYFDFVYALKLILDHFKYETYIILAHSYGAQTSLLFTQMYPEYVTKLICLDTIYYLPLTPNRLIPELRETIRRLEKFNKFDCLHTPAYTLDQAIERMKNARMFEISYEGAKTVLERSLIPTGDGKYIISTDQHLKYSIRPTFSIPYQVKLLKNYPIRCPNLVICAKESELALEVFNDVLDEMKKNKFFEYIIVEGTHDVHIEHPERVAPIISEFLLKLSSKL